MSFASSFNRSKSSNSSSSAQTSPEQLLSYWNTINDVSGGNMGEFATGGTGAITADQIRAAGGAGATRKLEIDNARKRALDEVNADASLSITQKQRARQLADEDFSARTDAINKEVESGLTDLVFKNRKMNQEDLDLLAKIFFGQMGSQSQSSGSSSAWGTSSSGGFSMGGM